jgi:hypothetical protein
MKKCTTLEDEHIPSLASKHNMITLLLQRAINEGIQVVMAINAITLAQRDLVAARPNIKSPISECYWALHTAKVIFITMGRCFWTVTTLARNPMGQDVMTGHKNTLLSTIY